MVAKAETATETESMEAAVGDCGSDASSSSSVESDEADGVMWKASAAKIRQQARDLLEQPPATASSNTSSSDRAALYESYHNDASSSSIGTVRISNTGDTYQRSSAPDTTWRSLPEYEVGESLSMTSVATMAFSCIAQCLTEGLRAASSYYADSPYQSTGEQHVSSEVNKYQQVEGFESRGRFSSDRLGETMERSPETREQWATVPVPSYQSG
ncbi:hypothetical protein THAOC_16035 [Thalassiosira oceanica]|uniref:Uncharacterized protein n=1 Tax=Thalassiosira oceanica TaxID=159749 RepID=K0SEC1_THAOC|nr:hypothetical protein THAOC_16035 [Thalassiosira oceanica]|eukprot:EJK63314.1 hypothetical protein THAOC_16035 [Thalassiosira oceanica]